MNLDGLVLHPAANEQLAAFLARPTHAVLLSGPPGTGKTLVAQRLVAALLGVNDSLKLANHPYVRVVEPTKNSIAIEQIRDLIDFFKLTVPGAATIKRVGVMYDADSMGGEAQNALLKLLEEPPADSVLLLTSSHPERLFTTIRSRLQLLQLPSPTTAQLEQFFAAQGYVEAAVQGAVVRANQNIAEIVQLLDGSASSDDALAVTKKVLAATTYERMLLVDGLAKQKEQANAFVDTLAIVANASLVAAATKGSDSLVRWQSVLEHALTAQSAFARNANPKLVLSELMLAL